LKLGLLVALSLGALLVTITSFIKDKLNYHFHYENVIYPIIIGVFSGITLWILDKINPTITNKKINRLLSFCVFMFINFIFRYFFL
jgi:hypothetical protein